MSDLVLNVKQISNYPQKTNATGLENILLQSGLGAPYQSITSGALVATALENAGSMGIGYGLPNTPPPTSGQLFASNFIAPINGGFQFNTYLDASGTLRYWNTGPAADWAYDQNAGFIWRRFPDGSAGQAITTFPAPLMALSQSGHLTLYFDTITVVRDPSAPFEVATLNWVQNNTVASFNNRTGPIRLTPQDIYAALSLTSPIATQAYANNAVTQGLQNFLMTCPLVSQWNGRSGSVYLMLSDITCVFFQSGQQPISPTPPAGSNDNSIATTQWVTQLLNPPALPSPTPPANPNNGQLWWDAVDGNLYVYYDDGTSAQWVSAMASSSSGSLSTSGGTMTGPLYWTATGAITSRSAQDRSIDVVYARDFGAIFDGNSHPLSQTYSTLAAAQAVYPKATALTNELDGIAVQAAIDFCAAKAVRGQESWGGTVVLPQALGLMNTPLTINNSTVSLVATDAVVGFRSNQGYWFSSACTLRWTGPAITAPNAAIYMLTIRPSDGGRFLSVCNVMGIKFDCNSTAGVGGVLIKSLRYSKLSFGVYEPRGVLYAGATTTAGSQNVVVSSTANILLGQSIWCANLPPGSYVAGIVNSTTVKASVQATTTGTVTVCIGGSGILMDVEDGIADSNDTQGNHCWFVSGNENAAAYQAGPCLMIGGSGITGNSTSHVFGNTSLNMFHDIHTISAHNAQMVINNSDHNMFEVCDVFSVGGNPVPGLILNGSSDPNNGGSSSNWFRYCGASTYAAGTDVAGFTTASINTWITFLDRANGGILSHVGTGATLLANGDSYPNLGMLYNSNLGIAPYMPDNTAMGGNGRGGFAVDLQTLRNSAAQVASGNSSVIAGGGYNTASGGYAFVGGGNSNTASGQFSSVPAGYFNNASQYGSVATGVSAQADLYCVRAHANDQVTTGKVGQQYIQILKGISAANTTPVRLTADGAAAGAINTMNLTYGVETLVLRVQLAATDPNGNSYVWNQPMGLLRRNGGVGAIVYIPGTPTSAGSGTTAGIAITEAADTTNGGYSLTFTPPTGNVAVWKICATVTATRCDG